MKRIFPKKSFLSNGNNIFCFFREIRLWDAYYWEARIFTLEFFSIQSREACNLVLENRVLLFYREVFCAALVRLGGGGGGMGLECAVHIFTVWNARPRLQWKNSWFFQKKGFSPSPPSASSPVTLDTKRIHKENQILY